MLKEIAIWISNKLWHFGFALLSNSHPFLLYDFIQNMVSSANDYAGRILPGIMTSKSDATLFFAAAAFIA